MEIRSLLPLLLAASLAGPLPAQAPGAPSGRHVLTARGETLYLNDREFLVKGLRTSNALISDAATEELIAHLDTFAAYGVNTVSVYFMGSRFGDVRGYLPDGSIDPTYGRRMERIVRAADARGMVVLVGVLYWGDSAGKHEHWTQAEAERAVANTIAWLRERNLRNVFVDIDNEAMAERALGLDPEGLVRAGKAVDPGYLIALNSRWRPAPSADLHVHFAPPVPGKPYVESEGTVNVGAPGGYWGAYSKRPDLYNYINVGVHGPEYREAQKRSTAEHLRRGHGYMLASTWLQAVPPKGPNHRPGGGGTPEDPGIRWWLESLREEFGPAAGTYFPPPDREGGWRSLTDPAEVRRVAGMDRAKLDEAFAFVRETTKHGGLLVVRNGWLVYEDYFGKGHREATANLASVGKSFTSIALGILMEERPDLFPEGLDQRVFTPTYFPPEAFPLSDPRRAEIRLGQLLAFSACIRGNSPGYVEGEPVALDPVGPDGWHAMVDEVALGKEDIRMGGTLASTRTLWCEPGGGYSYATSSIHLASILLRHVTGRELRDYVGERLARPLGWGRWGWGYRHAERVTHTPGGAGIVVRPTDMLRFGYLLLHEGRWGGRQLVPAEYVRHATRQSPYNPHFPYSLQFNVNTRGEAPELPRDAFWKSGSGGHALYVVPSLGLVVWKLGGRDGQYEARDTGLEVHPSAARGAEPREGWQPPPIEYQEALRRTLEMVVAAVEAD